MKILKITGKNRASVIFILLLIPLLAYLSLATYAGTPIGKTQASHTVDIPRGASFMEIVDILDEAGLIKHRLLFYLLAISQRANGRMKAGEYEFTDAITPLEIVNKMVRGDIKGYLVTFPEDLDLREVAARLAAYKLVDEKRFMTLATDKEFLSSLGLQVPSLEGYLFPDTYRLDRSMETRGVIRIMVNQFRKKVSPQMLNRAKELGFTTQEFITLASLIGKESGNKEEKPLISAVFHNRLKKGMKLQSDPTAVYDVSNFRGTITKRALLNDTPHNTYRINGLPPTPIANPGLDSLQAALNPAPVDYLYFVSKNNGTHSFSSNFNAHNQAISKYRDNKGETKSE